MDNAWWREGIGCPATTIRESKQTDESGMLWIPHADTAVVDPVLSIPTLNLICDVYDPISRKAYNRDPRHVARKAELYLKSTGIADLSYWGPEAEFYIFSDVRYDQTAHSGYYFVDSDEGIWNTGREDGPNLGYKLRHKEGYFPVPPSDQLQDVRSEIMLALQQFGEKV